MRRNRGGSGKGSDKARHRDPLCRPSVQFCTSGGLLLGWKQRGGMERYGAHIVNYAVISSCAIGRATPETLLPSVIGPHLRPLPSTGITRLHRYLRASPPPCRPGLSLAGFRFGPCIPPTGLPVLLPSSSSVHADISTPAETLRCSRGSLPVPSSAFPLLPQGRLPHYPFRGLLNVHSRSGLYVR